METIYQINDTLPMLFLAIHNGHAVSGYTKAKIGISEQDRMREEDPYTERFIKDKPAHIIQQLSRFECDINRSRDRAIYKEPPDCWDLPIYPKEKLTEAEINVSLSKYDTFYTKLTSIIDDLLKTHKKLLVWDVHSYNHRRLGPDAPFDSEEANPEIILGTTNYQCMPLHWKPLVDSIENTLKSQKFEGDFSFRSQQAATLRNLDVRQNIKFTGGNLSQFLNHKYGERLCCIAIEFKKIWMDEWTQKIDEPCLAKLKAIFDYTCFEALEQLKC